MTYESFSPIQVTMLNENVVTDQGLVYQVQDNSDVISVRVRAKTSVLRQLSSSDFTATADMEKNMKYGNYFPHTSLKFCGSVSGILPVWLVE